MTATRQQIEQAKAKLELLEELELLETEFKLIENEYQLRKTRLETKLNALQPEGE